MPLLRYFVFVGGALLALLFVCDAVFPSAPLPTPSSAGYELPAIRIRSNSKWPERVVIDTSIPTPAPAKVAAAEPVTAGPAMAHVRDALAQMPAKELKPGVGQAQRAAAPAPTRVAETTAKPTEPKPQPKRKSARTHPGRPMIIVAQQPRFGWFASTW
ncbi:conserved hypothetical protein [Bradyrhizobium sp. STM 3843]|uniref:hypothetical protein n=1 Tax=Bradyrhizobium sp. STM 3843 TaxID=551947 RepID=UPI0002403D33|nr:hypothetical protein [Bradyrhizobium sp. STM 3843]CCE10313.1 conserved hypothetical protein [Bradyrhizobium sp. STM 3843]